MAKKLKFKPEITRVKLNPEQAVLSCNCLKAGRRNTTGSNTTNTYCSGFTKTILFGSGPWNFTTGSS